MNEVTAAIPKHLLADPVKDAPKPKNVMGKDDFMKLLMAQLQNQDPLKPMDHQEFVAQLAQFGSMEQLTNINKGIEGLHAGIGNEAKISALSMIGKKVQAMGSNVDLMEGGSVTLKYTVKEDTVPVKAQVYTEGGTLVREIELSGKVDPEGIQWDGKDAEGKSMPTGRYAFRVQAVDPKGMAVELNTELAGRVTGVEIDGKTPMLVVQTPSGSTKVELAKIRNVSVDDGANDKKANASTSASQKVSAGTPSAAPAKAPAQQVDISAIAKQLANAEEGESEESESPADGAIASSADLDRMMRGFPDLTSIGGR